MPLLILCSLFFSLSLRATPFRHAHSRSIVPLVLLARSPNAGTAAIFAWWSGEGKERERGWKKEKARKKLTV